MKTDWDYSILADAYLKRADYSPDALQQIYARADLKNGDQVCDIGAGVAHLTLPLLKHGCKVDAVEPNDAMRANGIKRTTQFDNVAWSDGTGENTGKPTGKYDLVTFGSSFNVCDRNLALQEAHRLLKPGKYFVCLWNHRDLNDPVQKRIEAIIKEYLPDYGYGTRRENQSEVIRESGLFEEPEHFEGRILWKQPITETIEAWRSHATLERQAGERFGEIVDAIAAYLQSLNQEAIDVPYVTRVWLAKRKD